ncbi:MAG: glycosyltransferase family 4 protein [Patescibacteria group bacterium]|jgi:glycosyltransferase involved in cell wall biosynthesis
MKIGIITNLYPPFARGGAEAVIVRTVEELLAKGHDVFVITGQPRSEGKEIKLDRSSTERIYRFFAKNIYFTLNDYKYPWFVRFFWHAIDGFSGYGRDVVSTILGNEQPDVVITHNLKGLGLSIPRAIRARGVPHIHVIHDLQLVVPSGLVMFGHEETPWFAKPFYKLYQLICRLKFKNPDMVISPSHYLEKMYREAGFFRGTNIEVIPNPAPTYDVTPKIGRPEGPIKLLFVGQLSQHKGLVFLIEAVESLPGEMSLLIAGDGPLRKWTEKHSATSKRITYLGYMPPEELVNVLRVADALVVPSLCYENSPTVIYEGLQAGLPILASRIGGVGELVEEGKNGYLFTPGDKGDFLRALSLLDARKDDFANNRNIIRETVADYSLPKYAERLVKACEEAIRKHSGT